MKVDDKGERDLLKDFHSELSGDFRKTVLALYADPGVIDAQWMKEAMDGVGYNADLLLEILCTRTNEEIEKMKEAWTHIEKGTLVKRVSEETSKLFSSGNFQSFCATLLEAKRPKANGIIDDKAVMADAEHLNRVLTQEKKKEMRKRCSSLFLLSDRGDISRRLRLSLNTYLRSILYKRLLNMNGERAIPVKDCELFWTLLQVLTIFGRENCTMQWLDWERMTAL